MEERISIISVISLLLLRRRHCLALTVALLPERESHSHFLAGAERGRGPLHGVRRRPSSDREEDDRSGLDGLRVLDLVF